MAIIHIWVSLGTVFAHVTTGAKRDAAAIHRERILLAVAMEDFDRHGRPLEHCVIFVAGRC